jgi:hypothetical protein
MDGRDMKKWMNQRAQLKDQVEGLLKSLGPFDSEIAASLASAGVKGIPYRSRENAMTRYLSAVVASDARVISVMVSSRSVTVILNHWWVRDVVVPTPASVSSFMARFDRGDFGDLLAAPSDPWHTPDTEST